MGRDTEDGAVQALADLNAGWNARSPICAQPPSEPTSSSSCAVGGSPWYDIVTSEEPGDR